VEFLVFLGFVILVSALVLPVIALLMQSSLRERVNLLEKTVQTLQRVTANKPTSVAQPTKPAYVSSADPVKPPPEIEKVEPKTETLEVLPEAVPQTVSITKTENTYSPPPLPQTPRVSKEEALLSELKAMYEPGTTPRAAQTSTAQLGFFERLERWFIGGNVPVNVGILVLLAGVAALLKYATDRGLLSVPIELRLSAISLATMGALVFAWNKRHSHRIFSLSVQGGAIGILLLVVFAAYKLYRLLPIGAAFALSVGLIAGLAVLAVLQYSRTLAVLGILAGFLAPIWLSGGRSSHVGLFTWYALVNAGIFAMAWLRPWRALNVLGFAFTWGIGLIWGVLQYSPDKFVSSQAFLSLFFVFYLLLPLFYARRAEPISSGQARIDGTLVFGTPLVAFSLQSGLLAQRWPLALCALGLALIYLALAYTLNNRARRWQHLTQAYAILAVGFATLAVPLALSAQATASVFALEGAGLVWLGLTQRNLLAHWSGLGLQLAAAFSWMLGLDGLSIHDFSVITNAMCLSGVLIALAGFITAGLYSHSHQADVRAMALVPYLWALGWWLGTWMREIMIYGDFYYHQTHTLWRFKLHTLLLLLGLTAWLAAFIRHYVITPATSKEMHAQGMPLLTGTVLLCLLLAFTLVVPQYFAGKLSVLGAGTWMWIVFALLGLHSLYLLRRAQGPLPGYSQLVWLLLWASVWMLEAPRHWAAGWYGLMLALPWLVLVTLSIYRWSWLCWPLGAAFDPLRKPVQVIGLTILSLWWLVWLFNAGNSAPLSWVVVLNPLDLAQISALLLLALCLHQHKMPLPVPLALAALALITTMTLRTVHHWGHLPWNNHLFSSGLTQTSLTVVWSLLGMAGWIIGSKRGSWGLWLSGVLLMGAVLLKLLLIDRGNLGSIPGIIAFIIYGLFCTVIGGIAPMPPRRPQSQPERP